MSFLLLVFFILLPIVEIALLIDIGSNIGAGATILLIIATAVVGVGLFRHQGLSILKDAQIQISKGQPPANALAHGILVLLAGLMLIIPGFFTDGVGFLLLLPPVRSLLLDFVVGSMMTEFTSDFGISTLKISNSYISRHLRRPLPMITGNGYEKKEAQHLSNA